MVAPGSTGEPASPDRRQPLPTKGAPTAGASPQRLPTIQHTPPAPCARSPYRLPSCQAPAGLSRTPEQQPPGAPPTVQRRRPLLPCTPREGKLGDKRGAWEWLKSLLSSAFRVKVPESGVRVSLSPPLPLSPSQKYKPTQRSSVTLGCLDAYRVLKLPIQRASTARRLPLSLSPSLPLFLPPPSPIPLPPPTTFSIRFPEHSNHNTSLKPRPREHPPPLHPLPNLHPSRLL